MPAGNKLNSWKNGNLPKKKRGSDAKNLIIFGHYLIKGAISYLFLILEKLTSKELYQILISSRTNKVASVTYVERMFNTNNLDWTKIFILPRLTTYNKYLRPFQYKILHNILFLNKKLYLFGITKSALYSYCNTHDETRWNINAFVLWVWLYQIFIAAMKMIQHSPY